MSAHPTSRWLGEFRHLGVWLFRHCDSVIWFHLKCHTHQMLKCRAWSAGSLSYNPPSTFSREERDMLKREQSAAWLLVLTVLFVGLAGLARAQSTGDLRGTITDAQGGATPGVTIA